MSDQKEDSSSHALLVLAGAVAGVLTVVIALAVEPAVNAGGIDTEPARVDVHLH